MNGPHWRIENNGQVVTDAKVIFVDEEGNETDVSRTVQKVDLDLTIGEVSRATIYAILVESRVEVKEAEAELKKLPRRRSRIGRWADHRVYAFKGWVARQLSPQLQREIAKNWKQKRLGA